MSPALEINGKRSNSAPADPAGDGDDESISLKIRFLAWWEGVDPASLMGRERKGKDADAIDGAVDADDVDLKKMSHGELVAWTDRWEIDSENRLAGNKELRRRRDLATAQRSKIAIWIAVVSASFAAGSLFVTVLLAFKVIGGN